MLDAGKAIWLSDVRFHRRENARRAAKPCIDPPSRHRLRWRGRGGCSVGRVMPVTVAALVDPTEAQLADVTPVFDQYRQHYDHAVVPGRALAWLRHHIDNGRLSVFTAHAGEHLVGLATAVTFLPP
jgi:hypothetical protein